MKEIKFLFKALLVLAVLLFALFCFICINFPVEHLSIINKYSEKYSLDPALVCAVINTESGFNENVTSHKGARGLMQLMPDTIDWAVEQMPYKNFSYTYVNEPDVNINIGCWLLKYLLDYYDGDEDLAIAAYNAGLGTVNKWLKDENVSTKGTLTDIPFKETRNYVKKIEFNQAVYSILLRIGVYE
ncbi:MAG: lytic transglycosylase domain-containing protein [Firmicutes bacterium]|nr:lytic transglycosylase domain-containing protein [Bacillota bacterium]